MSQCHIKELGQVTRKAVCLVSYKSKKMVSELEVKLSDLKKELNDKQLEIDHRITKAEEIGARLKLLSADINRKNRKIDHERCILKDAYMLFKQLEKRKENHCFQFLHV